MAVTAEAVLMGVGILGEEVRSASDDVVVVVVVGARLMRSDDGMAGP